MINTLNKFLNKVATIRSITGEEYIAKIMEIDSDNNMLTLANPRVVVINDDQVVLVPFVLTASSEKVSISVNNVFSVIETLPQTAKDYGTLVAQEYIRDNLVNKPVEVVAEPVVDKY